MPDRDDRLRLDDPADCPASVEGVHWWQRSGSPRANWMTEVCARCGAQRTRADEDEDADGCDSSAG